MVFSLSFTIGDIVKKNVIKPNALNTRFYKYINKLPNITTIPHPIQNTYPQPTKNKSPNPLQIKTFNKRKIST